MILSEQLEERIITVLEKMPSFPLTIKDIIGLHSEDIYHLGIAKDNHNMISYLDKRRYNEVDTFDRWNPEKRLMIKIGKMLKRLFPSLSDKELTDFSALYTNENKICDECLDTSVVTFVKGDDIRHYYHQENYASQNHQEDGNNSDILQSCKFAT